MKTLLKISLTLSTILCLASLQTHAMNGGDDDKPKGTPVSLKSPPQTNVTTDNAGGGASGTVTVSQPTPPQQKDAEYDYGAGNPLLIKPNFCFRLEEGQMTCEGLILLNGVLSVVTDKKVAKDDEKKAPKK